MTKLTHVDHERATGMLQANVSSSVAAKQFQCHVKTIGGLKYRLQQTWTTSDHPCPGHSHVLMRRQDQDIPTSHLCNRFYLETVTAMTYSGTHNP